MKYIFYIILSLLHFSCSEPTPAEINTDPETVLIPKKYEGFYAGMSVSDFELIAYSLRYTIMNTRDDWSTDEENQVLKPGLTFYAEGCTYTADFWENRIAEITIEGNNIPEFEAKLQEIVANFDNDRGNSNLKSYYDGDIKTKVDVLKGILKFTHVPLNVALYDECSSRQKVIDQRVKIEEEKKKIEIQKKYQ